uniref:Rab-GAP TBC domain-containing protein n=1 Tax=Biomphalaria glabrata TaxID=6526 RepID=A0A2C9L1G2_BIOGL
MNVLDKLRPSKSSKNTDQSGPPSKEDILNTLESFTINKSLDRHENNNNSDSISHGSRTDAKFDFVDSSQPTSSSASMSHSYSTEWEKLFNTPDMMKKLKEKSMEGELRSSRFRSLIWKLFLEVLPPSKEEWVEKTKQSRNKFEDLKNKLIVNPRKAVDSVDITLNNPLSQDEESPWNKFFQDNELRLTIKQDVIRTTFGKHTWKECYPKIEFFQSNQLRNLMVNILFIFAKENPELSYRQGMHELLAPLIFVLHCDHQAFLHACEIESVNYLSVMARDIIKVVMDPNYLEHDAYTMFCQVMETVEPWYLSRDIFYNTKTGSMRNLEMINATPFSRSQDLNPSSVIVTKLTRIQDYILKKFDPELHQHLERLEIAPQIYGIRWLRLLFGREFPMQDLLMLWDAIFGDGIGFDLVDYIFVAMLLYIKDNLLTSDYATCLTVLMKYPQVTDVHYFVVKARWLREPNQPRPPVYTHQGSIKMSSSMGESSESISNITRDTVATTHHHTGQKRQNTSLGGFSSFSRKFSRPRTLSVPKSSSEPMNLQTDISPETANNPIGSTVSLSQVEESMFRPSAASMARMDATNLRSAQSSPGLHPSSIFPMTPDDVSITTSPPLPGGKSRGRQKKMTKSERELQDQISRLQGEQNDMNSMCRYCASKLDVHIGRLQQELSKQSFAVDDDIMVSLAGLKLVRDILNGTLKFSQNIAADEDEIQINDEYYGNQNGDRSITSPDSDILLGATSCIDDDLKISRSHKARLFYMSSEDASSLDSGSPSVQGKVKGAGDQAMDYTFTADTDLNIQDKMSIADKNANTQTSNSSGQFTSKIRSLFKSEPSGSKMSTSTSGSASGNLASQPSSSIDTMSFQSSQSPEKARSDEKQPLRSSQTEREMMPFDTRPRACSNLETQTQYWPDFTAAVSAPWYSKEMYHGDRKDGRKRREEHVGRERSKSQPSTSTLMYRQDYDMQGLNPLYRLHYQDNMDH